MEWTHTDGDHTYATSLIPLLLAAAGLGLVVWMQFAARWRLAVVAHGQRGGIQAALPVMLVGGLVVAAGCVTAGRSFFSNILIVKLDAWQLFGKLLSLELSCALGATLLVGVWLFRRARGSGAGRDRLMVGAWILSLMGVAHLAYVVALGRWPSLDDDWQAWVHQGQEARIAPRFWSDLPRSGWTLGAPRPIDTRKPGKTTVVLRVSRFLAHVALTRTFQVRRELGHPSFPLRVGNRWVYARKRSRVDSLWRPSHSVTDRVVLEVTGTRVQRGLRQFSVRRTVGGKSATAWIYAMDGKLYMASDPHMRRSTRDSTAHRALTLPAVGSVAQYSFALLTGDCLGVALPTGPYNISGPCDCLASKGGGPLSAMLMIFTLGAAAPGLSDDERVLLERSVAGPPDAQAAPSMELAALPARAFARDHSARGAATTSACKALRGHGRLGGRYCVAFELQNPSRGRRFRAWLKSAHWLFGEQREGQVFVHIWDDKLRKAFGWSIGEEPLPSYGCPTRRCREVLRGPVPRWLKKRVKSATLVANSHCK